ncbi:RAD-like 6 [Hibiscus syriacus]|uniref:RING-type E3 ubiquitin transferase n=1 Tax=Hibiscus syriacus TaxID=106335 RepID=A0A6A3AM99_HIBSY|nr:RAD-like 6 [Hibiscus syriacus]
MVEVVETPSYPTSFKVHCRMCTELWKFVDRIIKIFPEIEVARPGALRNEGTVLAEQCNRESKVTSSSMVPVKLVDEISQIVDDLRAAKFFPDKFEDEAWKVVRELLQRGAAASDSIEYDEMKALQTAASRLHITSPKAISIEKESIKKLLEKMGDGDQQKKNILKYLLYLLRKYANLISGVQTDNTSDRNEGAFAAHTRSADAESHTKCKQYDARAGTLNRAIYPPEEFKCPPSSRLMYDPVVIASGQTFERTWILKWKYGNTIQDPSMQPDMLPSLENSSTSISSLGGSMNDLGFPLNISNISLGSLDTNYTLDGSRNRIEDVSSLMPEETSDDLGPFRPLRKTILSSANDLHDLRARRAGFKLLSTFLSKNRNGTRYLSEDAYSMLSLFIDSEVTREVLDIMSVLSEHSSSGSKIYPFGALVSMLNILDSNVKDFQEQILKILRNLSSSTDICSDLDLEITRTSGCIASIAVLLETGVHEDQEHAPAILLTLCSQSIEYCHSVMDECNIFPLLFFVSANGSRKGKATAMELLRLLRDTKHDKGDGDEHECSKFNDIDSGECSNSNDIDSEEFSNSNNIESKDANDYSKEKVSRKALFRVKLPMFSRTSAPKKENETRIFLLGQYYD